MVDSGWWVPVQESLEATGDSEADMVGGLRGREGQEIQREQGRGDHSIMTRRGPFCAKEESGQASFVLTWFGRLNETRQKRPKGKKERATRTRVCALAHGPALNGRTNYM